AYADPETVGTGSKLRNLDRAQCRDTGDAAAGLFAQIVQSTLKADDTRPVLVDVEAIARDVDRVAIDVAAVAGDVGRVPTDTSLYRGKLTNVDSVERLNTIRNILNNTLVPRGSYGYNIGPARR